MFLSAHHVAHRVLHTSHALCQSASADVDVVPDDILVFFGRIQCILCELPWFKLFTVQVTDQVSANANQKRNQSSENETKQNTRSPRVRLSWKSFKGILMLAWSGYEAESNKLQNTLSNHERWPKKQSENSTINET